MKRRSNLEQVDQIAESKARLIEGTVIKIFPQTRTAQVRLDGSSQYINVALGHIDPSLVNNAGSRVLLYRTSSIIYALSAMPGQYVQSSPGVTLGDRWGGTKFSVYNSQQEEVLYIDSLGNLSGGIVATDHGALTGLGDDDHPQYAAITQVETVSGAWTFSANITLSGATIDGITPSDHDARHERAGADEIDGDHLGISWNPSNYTPATTPSEAASIDDLTAHLYGIDQELSAVTDDKRIKVSTDDTTPGFLEEKLVVSHGTNTANPLELSTLAGGGDEDRQLQLDEAKVDHDALLNFVGNEHIDHTAVTLTTGDGLTGGGTIAANRTFDVDVTDFIDTDYGLTESTNDIRINLAATSGLNFSAGALLVGAGDGIDVLANTIAVDVTDFIDTSYGLTEDSNNIRVNLAATSGLNFSTGALLVGAGDGIDVLTNTVAVDVTDILGNGLGETSNNIYVYSLRQSDDGAAALTADAAGDMTAYGGITFDVAESIATTAGNLTITPAGDIIFDPVGNDVLPLTNYDINLGKIDKKFLTLHAAELWVETLVAQDTIATIGGRILVGPTTKLTSDLGTGDTTIYVEHNQMADGDTAYMEADGKVEFIGIDSAAGGVGPYSYTVVRNLDGTGANLWYAGDAVFNTGNIGDGFIDLYSLSGPGRSLVDDEDGSSWGSENHWLRLDGTAFIEVQGVDLSPYAGTEGSDTDHIIVLKDSADKSAWGYLGAVGAGKSYGSNQALNEGFESFSGTVDDGNTDDFTSWTEGGTDADDTVEATATAAVGSYACKIVVTDGTPYIEQSISVTEGDLIAVSFQTRGDDTIAGRYEVRDVTNAADIIAATSTGVTGTTYATVQVQVTIPDNCVSLRLRFYGSASAGTAYFDDVGLKSVTEAAATGLHVIDALNGSSQGWAYIETGFDYNDSAYTFEIRLNRTSVGPTIVGNIRNSNVFNDWAENWAIGNLNGLYGYGTDIYGAAFGRYGGADYLTIDSTNGIRFFDEFDDAQASLTSGAWTLGKVGAGLSNVYITSGAVQLRTNTTVNLELTTAGQIIVGDDAGGEYLTVDSNGIEMFANAVKVVDIDGATGDFIFGEVATNKSNLFWDQSEGRLNFRGGTGGTVVEAYVDTDGSIVAGAGSVIINSDGIMLTAPTTQADLNSYKFMVGSDVIGALYGVEDSADVRRLTLSSTADAVNELAVVTLKVISGDFLSSASVVAATTSSTTHLELSGSDYIKLDTGNVYINDSENTEMTQGLTINQGANDDEIMAWKASEVAHGATDFAETDTFGNVQKAEDTSGGLKIAGLKDSGGGNYAALQMQGLLAENVDTTKSTSGLAISIVDGFQTSGASIANTVADGNVFCIRTYRGSAYTTLFIVDEDGDIHRDGSLDNAFDQYDDALAVSDLAQGLAQNWNDGLQFNFDRLRSMGVISGGNRERPFVSTKRLDALMMGAIGQLYERCQRYERVLIDLGASPEMLQS